MVVASLSAAAAILLLLPLVFGICMTFFVPEKDRENVTAAGLYIKGAAGFFVLFEITYLAVSVTGRGLSHLRLLWAFLFVLLFAGSVFVFIKRRALYPGLLKTGRGGIKGLLLPAFSFIVIALVIVFQRPYAELELYSGAERVMTVASQGSFFGIDPLTGQMILNIGIDERLESLTVFQAMICTMTGAEIPLFLRYVFSFWMVFASLVQLSVLGDAFLRDKAAGAHKTWLYICFLIAALFGNGGYRNPFFDLVFATYEGRCLVSFLVLPGLFAAFYVTGKGKKRPGRHELLTMLASAALYLVFACFAGGFSGGFLPAAAEAFIWGITLWLIRSII